MPEISNAIPIIYNVKNKNEREMLNEKNNYGTREYQSIIATYPTENSNQFVDSIQYYHEDSLKPIFVSLQKSQKGSNTTNKEVKTDAKEESEQIESLNTAVSSIDRKPKEFRKHHPKGSKKNHYPQSDSENSANDVIYVIWLGIELFLFV